MGTERTLPRYGQQRFTRLRYDYPASMVISWRARTPRLDFWQFHSTPVLQEKHAPDKVGLKQGLKHGVRVARLSAVFPRQYYRDQDRDRTCIPRDKIRRSNQLHHLGRQLQHCIWDPWKEVPLGIYWRNGGPFPPLHRDQHSSDLAAWARFFNLEVARAVKLWQRHSLVGTDPNKYK